MHLSVSLIISTYNWPEALALCLKSVLDQRVLPDEVIVADDGSGESTRRVVDAFRETCPVPVLHIWQEDDGFRLARIRNKAIAAAKGEYIVQIDGDILMHPFFISDHIRFARKDAFVRASRVYLDAALSKYLMETGTTAVSIFSKGLSNFFSALHVPLLWPFFATAYKNKGDERYEIHGCNMAFWRQDAIAVNGYNEDFSGWGPEDKEFVARLLNMGKVKRFLKLGGIAFHLYHKENPKPNLGKNEAILKHTILNNLTNCSTGINNHIVNAEQTYSGTSDRHL